MSKKVLGIAAIIAIGVSCAANVMAERPTARAKPAWLGLYTRALIGWLENENRINTLCAQTGAGSSQRDECRAEMLKPRQSEIKLHDEPRPGATPAGTIVVEATPGRGLRAFFRPATGAPATEFVPDLFDVDWGYGPYFHQTFLEQRGPWFLLPAGPLPRPAWVNLSEFGDDANLRRVEVGDIVTGPLGDLFVLGVETGSLRVRPEQKADMLCEGGDPPPLKPFKETLIPANDLYSEDGHLLVKIKHTRGC